MIMVTHGPVYCCSHVRAGHLDSRTHGRSSTHFAQKDSRSALVMILQLIGLLSKCIEVFGMDFKDHIALYQDLSVHLKLITGSTIIIQRGIKEERKYGGKVIEYEIWRSRMWKRLDAIAGGKALLRKDDIPFLEKPAGV